MMQSYRCTCLEYGSSDILCLAPKQKKKKQEKKKEEEKEEEEEEEARRPALRKPCDFSPFTFSC